MDALSRRITFDPDVFGSKPVVRARRLAVEHVLAMLKADDTVDDLLSAYGWLGREDVLARVAYARRAVANERIDPVRLAG
ncbi:MAG: DUF433 domain-containing protein [Fimbriimonadaceae bacterium]|nr:DUF433 domain-containing protein [Fimbriimonadaceae bacterium]QYK58946.1 MAG: DUF433 domain-containing protein [Fimbriimonadaceae bacterium]